MSTTDQRTGAMQRASALLRTRLLTWLLLGLATVVGVGSSGWVGADFPGFFVLPNRVVASAGLPGWAGADEGRPVFQHVLVAVDGMQVLGATDGYARAARQLPGQSVAYDFIRNGTEEQRVFPLRTFRPADYVAIFGAYLLSGLAYVLLVVVARRRWRDDPAAGALTALGTAGAVFCLTAVDLYGPGLFFRLHVVGETFLLATLVHLALVCPGPVRGGRELVPLLYALAGLVALVCQLFLYDPRAYSALHNLCQGLMLVPILVLAVRLTLAAGQPDAAAEAPRLRWRLGGVLLGLVGPALIFGLSSLTGGAVPVSLAGWLNFIYPLAVLVSLQTDRAPLRTAAAHG